MIGTTLSQYRIVEKLGEGGMGEVYLAKDTRLKRKVALKVLATETASDPERLARFKREAETVAALNHPNIVTIHSVEQADGTHFLTMEWVEGKTLGQLMSRGAMPLERLFELGIPIADALSAAHEKGITHRDLKPANVMVSDEGRVKILDFGLAKLQEEALPEEAAEQPTQALTKEGLAVGTVPYMSPEQVRGEEVDHRTDIFSLGILLYEMISGQRPFHGKNSADLVSSILRDRPPTVTELKAELPHHLGRVIQRCLEKDPEKRFQTAKDVRNELEGLKGEVESGVARVSSTAIPTVAGVPSRRRPAWIAVAAAAAVVLLVAIVWWLRSSDSVATPPTATSVDTISGAPVAPESERLMAVVLPFENLGPAEDAYFAAGITDEVSGRLASVSGLGVISRQTAARYADTDKSIHQIGEELGVDYVLGGTVRWARQAQGVSRVRISPELIRVADDRQVWTETYDREIDDIFEVQSEIASQVIQALGVTLLGSEEQSLEARPTDSVEAYQAYLKARDLELHGTTPQEFDEAVVQLYERAVELDPDFVEAWSRLSRHHSSIYQVIDRTEARLSRAKSALERAEALGADLPAVRLARGYYHYYGFREYDQALAEFQAAETSLPNDPQMRQAIGLIYRRQGRLDEALAELEQAQNLDPQNVEVLGNLAGTYRAQRRPEETLRYRDRLIALEPDQDSHYSAKASDVVELLGDLEQARAFLEQMPARDEASATIGWVIQHFREREFTRALERLAAWKVENPLFRAFRLELIAWARYMEGGPDAAKEDLEAAARELTELLEPAPSNAVLRQLLGVTYALLGDEGGALREGRLAVDLTAKDAFSGPQAVENLAAIYARIGRTDEALDQLERLLAMDYAGSITVHRLRFDFWWDPLRTETRFQALINQRG